MSAYKYEDGLITDRLYTRFLTPEDIEPWTEFFEDKESIQYFPWVANDTAAERSKQWIDRQLLRYKEKRYGLQALIRKDTNEIYRAMRFDYTRCKRNPRIGSWLSRLQKILGKWLCTRSS